MVVVLAVICVIFLSNCGGGGNSSVVPNTNPTTENPVSYTNPTPTPVLSNVNVSGYLYVNNTVTEDGETVPGISVLDVPACQSDSSGNESFLTQFSNSIKADYPEDWAKAEIQELYAQLNKTLSESKPLPEYNAQAQLYSAYNDTSIPVGSDGHFDNTVLTGATDSNVKLGVALGEDNYAEVETLPSSGSINSSDATSAVLKSCPEKIFAFPGTIALIRITANGVNLKKAGLKVSLDNPEIGCISQPVYLCIFGDKKYQTAYICLYVKNGLDTPTSTNITATMNTGLSLKIFTEVIKKCSSISGTVYTGGMPLVKGFVYSIGTRSYCKLDSNGYYTLPKVFRGHERSVVAVWQTSENGLKLWHREEKVIDFFNSELTGFNFGVLLTPTPTFTPSATPTPRDILDPFYDKQVTTAFGYFDKWSKELNSEPEAIQKVVDWINRKLNSAPPIPDGMVEAYINQYDSSTIMIKFDGGVTVRLMTKFVPIPTYEEVNTLLNQKKLEENINSISKKLPNTSIARTEKINFEPKKMLILDPIFGWQYWFSKLGPCHYDVADYLDYQTCFDYKTKITTLNEIKFDFANAFIDPNVNAELPFVPCKLGPNANHNNIVTPWDYGNFVNYPDTMLDYGMIFITTHGNSNCLVACVYIADDPSINDWLRQHSSGESVYWDFSYQKIDFWTVDDPARLLNSSREGIIKTIVLRKEFFDILYSKSSREHSVIYIDSCYSTGLYDAFTQSGATYLGMTQSPCPLWDEPLTFYLFRYMLFGYTPDQKPSKIRGYAGTSPGAPLLTENEPMHLREAYNTLTDYYKVNKDPGDYGPNCPAIIRLFTDGFNCQDCFLALYDPPPVEKIYFPSDAYINMQKK